ncbi:MAG TPA: alpha/beta hydrolase [Burkholderiales bacterium]|nr:alpha/beta hydrolase [Burkholderiales bacterium]
MKLADYPPQEPLSEAGQAYSAECWKRSEGIPFREESYGPDAWQRLAIYEPRQADGRVLLFWHGGGWTSGYKEWFGFMAPAFTAAGITFISAGYRLAPQHLFPTGLEDCVSALGWVEQNVSKNIYIGGHSAGGHYAALIAARGGGNRVKGCLPISGVYEFGEGSGLTMRPRFLGSTEDRLASPRYQLQPPLPPFLVAYGTKDFAHLIPQAERFVEAVRAAGGKAQALPMEGRTHFTASYAGGEADGPWVPAALAFMS